MFPGLLLIQWRRCSAADERSSHVSTTTEGELFQITDARASQLLRLSNTTGSALVQKRRFSVNEYSVTINTICVGFC
jgi:hypothetical protein